VKAHHFRLELFDDGAHRGIEGKPVRHRDRRCRVDAQFNVIRFEFFPPRILALIVGNRHFVREEVQIDRLTSGGLAKLCHLGPHLICAKHAGRQGAEPAGLCNGDRKLGVHRAGHSRQQNGVLDPKKIQQASIGPHGHDPCTRLTVRLARRAAATN
jgi:hypothetical protein